MKRIILLVNALVLLTVSGNSTTDLKSKEPLFCSQASDSKLNAAKDIYALKASLIFQWDIDQFKLSAVEPLSMSNCSNLPCGTCAEADAKCECECESRGLCIYSIQCYPSTPDPCSATCICWSVCD